MPSSNVKIYLRKGVASDNGSSIFANILPFSFHIMRRSERAADSF